MSATVLPAILPRGKMPQTRSEALTYLLRARVRLIAARPLYDPADDLAIEYLDKAAKQVAFGGYTL